MRLLKSIATVSSFTMVSRVSGFMRDILMAAILGAGPLADAFVVAFQLPNFFRRMFAEGAFNTAFIPTFSALLEKEDRARACQCAEDALSSLFFVLLMLVLFFEIFLPWILLIIAPGFRATPDRLHLAIEFTRVTFPYILFISLAALYAGVLNSLNRFAAAAGAPILLNLIMIAALLGFRQSSVGMALVWAVLIAGVAQWGCVMWALSRAGIRLRLKFPTLSPDVRHILKLMGPSALGAGVVQINLLIGIMFSSLLPTGSLSYLYYADRVVQLPLSVIGIAASTALLPTLSRQFQSTDLREAHATQNRTIEFAFALILPAAVGLMVFAQPIVGVLFERDAFGAEQTDLTAAALGAYAVGLPAYVAIKVFSTSFFARHDTVTPVKTAVVSVLVNVGATYLLAPIFGVAGIAVASVLSAWTNTVLLGFYLWRRKLLIIDLRLQERFPRLVLASLGMGVFLMICLRGGADVLSRPGAPRAFLVLGIIGAAVMLYMLISFLLKAIDLKELKKSLRA